jgi:hypothetical protein
MFYGSGNDSSRPFIPDELRWRVETLEAKVALGLVSLLDIVIAIKSAMPSRWLAERGMEADCVSIVFSKSDREILDLYVAALNSWGACNTVEDDMDDSVLSSAILPIESVPASAYDVPKTVGQNNGRGFSFSRGNLQVTFPNGPICCFTEAVVDPRSTVKFAHFSFKDLGGNSAWSVGVIPESQSHNSCVLWGSQSSIGRHCSGSGSCLRPVRFSSGDVLTSCIDALHQVWYLCVNGQIVAQEQVPSSLFPVRLGLCGHNGSRFELIPHACAPPQVVEACAYPASASSADPVVWQVRLFLIGGTVL